nr:primosomal protein N' [Euzebyales bacterium]
PEGYWEREAPRRAELRYPPASSLIRLVAPNEGTAAEVAAAAREALPPGDEVLGPDLDHGLLLKCAQLRGTLVALTPLRHAWDRAGRGVRIDVDPLL